MKEHMLSSIREKADYLALAEAVTGEKTVFTKEEKAKLLEIYAENATNRFGFENAVLVRAVLALDVPGANLLDKADADALSTLCTLFEGWDQKPERAGAVRTAALNGDVSEPMALAMARAALDTYAMQKDLVPYREDIRALTEFLRGAEEDAFSEGCAFLVRVRERVRK